MDRFVSVTAFVRVIDGGGLSAPAAPAALTTLVPRLPAFAADLAQHATDGGHDLIR